jgi:hypothetical protein
MTAAVIEASLGRLATRRPVFHSEADFQHALAWQLQLDHPDARIRLETRPLPGHAVFLDLAVSVDGVRTAIELKYLVKALVTEVDGEHFELRAQSAHDVRRYDVVKDLRRLEEVVSAGAADVGVMAAITNDPAYWVPGRAGTIDAAFRLHEGAVLAGSVGWAEHAGPGTTAKRTEMLSLVGSYAIEWTAFSDTGDRAGQFRKLVVEVSGMRGVQPAAGPETVPDVVAVPTEGDVRSSYDTTCRQEILDAFAALERRHSRAVFSPVELVTEVLARGSGHPESTIRTHIISAMCVNAPPNHTVRYPDLERVDRGLYRRLVT